MHGNTIYQSTVQKIVARGFGVLYSFRIFVCSPHLIKIALSLPNRFALRGNIGAILYKPTLPNATNSTALHAKIEIIFAL
jgi:hypothetical protein